MEKKVYPELTPMLQLKHSRILCMSSQINIERQTSNKYIDIDSVRGEYVLFNKVCYVCKRHIKPLIQSDIKMNKCMCFYFSQPRHLECSNDIASVLDSFGVADSKRNNNLNGQNRMSDTYSTMLAEIGIILNENGTLTNIHTSDTAANSAQLANQFGHDMLHKPLDVKKLINKTLNGEGYVSNTVYVYYDPAPMVSEISKGAIAFIVKVHTTDNMQTKKKVDIGHEHLLDYKTMAETYVLLAMEEFENDQVLEHNSNYQKVGAHVILNTITAINILYGGYFTKYNIFPEANSFCMREFYTECLAHEWYNTEASMSVSLYVSTKKVKKTSYSVNRKRKHEEQIKGSHTSLSHAHEPDIEERVGYCLAGKKVFHYLNFFIHTYNSGHLRCASQIYTANYMHINYSDVVYISEVLGEMKIKVKPNNTQKGKHSYSVCGKKHTSSKGYVTDDLADAIINACVLCNKYESAHTTQEEHDQENLLLMCPGLDRHSSVELVRGCVI